MTERLIPMGYRPRWPQWELHEAVAGGSRRTLLVWHRRCGKTMACVHELIRAAAVERKPQPMFAYIAPFRIQAKAIAWRYLRRFTSAIPGAVANESELRVDLPGERRIQLFGADNPDALRGLYFDGVVLDEYGQIKANLRSEVLIPALTDRKGWEIVCGTPKGVNQFYDLFQRAKADPSWRTFFRPAGVTRVLSDEQLEDARKEMSLELFQQEFECSWVAASKGTYFAAYLQDAEEAGRITSVPYDAGLPVTTSWDLGVGDATAIWFWQRMGMELRCIDYYENEGVGLVHYAEVLKKRGYFYDEHLVPFDADNRTMLTGRTLVDHGRDLGMPMRVVARTSLEDGIEAARRILPRTWFDRGRCAPGIKSLTAYQRKWSERLNVWLDSPEHDWASHGADAFRYFAVDEVTRLRPPAVQGQVEAEL